MRVGIAARALKSQVGPARLLFQSEARPSRAEESLREVPRFVRPDIPYGAVERRHLRLGGVLALLLAVCIVLFSPAPLAAGAGAQKEPHKEDAFRPRGQVTA